MAQRLAEVRRRIERAGGDPGTVTVVAVTKGFGPWAVEAAADVGLLDVGENYPQEMLAKAAQVHRPALRWHAIGRLQRNKVKALADLVHCWQSIDRPELAAELARRRPGARALVQVNVSGEAQKGGVDPGGVSGLVAHCRGLELEVAGLMAVGATGDVEVVRQGFALLRRCADDLGLQVRSMGMSGDLEAAVAEGSTMVRVGSALFGDRHPDR